MASTTLSVGVSYTILFSTFSGPSSTNREYYTVSSCFAQITPMDRVSFALFSHTKFIRIYYCITIAVYKMAKCTHAYMEVGVFY